MADEMGWMLEAAWSKPGAPIYLCAGTHGSDGSYFFWSRPGEHEIALRFAREVDAIRFSGALRGLSAALFIGPDRLPIPRVAAHAWIGAQDDDDPKQEASEVPND